MLEYCPFALAIPACICARSAFICSLYASSRLEEPLELRLEEPLELRLEELLDEPLGLVPTK